MSISARVIRKAGYLIAAVAAVGVWLLATIAAGFLTAASLLPFQIFPGPGVSLLAIIVSAIAVTLIFNFLTKRVGGASYVALLLGAVVISSLLVFIALVGIYAVFDESPSQRIKLEGEYSHAYSVWFSTDGRALVGAGKDFLHPVVRSWEAQTGKLQRTTRLVSDDYLLLEDAVFSPDGQTLATPNSLKKAFLLWDVPTGNLRLGPISIGDNCCTGGIRTIFSPDSKTFVTVSMGSDRIAMVTLWDAQTGELRRTLPGELAAFSPDARALAIRDGTHEAISILDAQTLDLKLVLPIAKFSQATVLVFSSDGRTLISNAPYPATDGTPDIGSWDLHTARFERRLSERLPNKLVFSPDGRLLALNDKHMVEIYDARTWRRLRRFQPYESSWTFTGSGRKGDPVRSRVNEAWPRMLAFSPDGKTLVTTCSVGLARLWDVSEL